MAPGTPRAGTSIAEGKGYRLLNEPGEIKAVRQPPLLPAFVTVTLGAGPWFVGLVDGVADAVRGSGWPSWVGAPLAGRDP